MERQRSRKSLSLVALVVAVLALTTATFSGGVAGAATPSAIPIRAILPLSGPAGPSGKQMLLGIQGIFGQFNAKGGVKGVKVDLTTQDDQFDPTRYKQAIQKAISDNVLMIAGSINSTGVTAALSDITAANLPLMPDLGADAKLSYTNPSIFSPFVPCAYWKMGAYQYLHEKKKINKFASIQLGTPVFTQCDASVSPALQKIGASSVSTQTISLGAADCTAQVVNAQQAGAQAIGIFADNLTFQHCVQAAKQQGFSGPIVTSVNVIDTPSVLQALGRDAEGIYAASPYVLLNSKAYQNLCGKAVAKYSNNDTEPGGETTEGCLGAYAVVQALKAIGPNATRADLIKYWETHVIDTKGVSAPLHFGFDSSLPHLPFNQVQVVQVKDGAWKSLTGFFTAKVSVTIPS